LSRQKITATSKARGHEANPIPRVLWRKLGLLLCAVIACLGLCEILLRVFFRQSLGPVNDERSLTYRYDSELGWFPVPNSTKRFTGSRTITVTHNSKGFRDREPVETNKPRIVFLGDSLVWGFDAEAGERFTEKLQADHPEWAVYNMGVSGYGTDQEYLLLQRFFADYRPRVVFLVVCGDNDNEDNAWNIRGGYYKPFYTLEGGRLKVNNVPVPRSAKVIFAEHPMLCAPYVVRLAVAGWRGCAGPRAYRNTDPPTGALLLDLRRYVTDRRATFAVGLQHSHPDIERFLRDHQIPYVSLETTNPAHVYPEFGHHWTPEGQKFVAEKIEQFLGK
jgi:GDSL-like lipase/acylhydrolase family protein